MIKNYETIKNLLATSNGIAVVQTTLPSQAVFIAKKLLEKGVRAMEIAYRDCENYDGSDECIRAVVDEVPEMLIGAATITNPKLAKRAIKAGARFILTAGFNQATVRYCVRKSFPIFPGVSTPGEIEQAMMFGLDALKLFPVKMLGGTDYLKALNGPYPDVQFIVTGGVNAENAEEYKNCPNVLCVSGSFLCK